MKELVGKCIVCGDEVFKDNGGYYQSEQGVLCSERCFYHDYYSRAYKEYMNGTLVVVDGRLYSIGDEQSDFYSRGFGGRKFIFQLDNGKVIESTNVWYNGLASECELTAPEFIDKFKNNAKIVEVSV